MGREIAHPPNPKGATSRELADVQRLHRATGTGDVAELRRGLSDAVELIVELIEDRMSRRQFDASYDVPSDGG